MVYKMSKLVILLTAIIALHYNNINAGCLQNIKLFFLHRSYGLRTVYAIRKQACVRSLVRSSVRPTRNVRHNRSKHSDGLSVNLNHNRSKCLYICKLILILDVLDLQSQGQRFESNTLASSSQISQYQTRHCLISFDGQA